MRGVENAQPIKTLTLFIVLASWSAFGQDCGLQATGGEPQCPDQMGCISFADGCSATAPDVHFCQIRKRNCLCPDGSQVNVTQAVQGSGGACATCCASVKEPVLLPIRRGIWDAQSRLGFVDHNSYEQLATVAEGKDCRLPKKESIPDSELRKIAFTHNKKKTILTKTTASASTP